MLSFWVFLVLFVFALEFELNSDPVSRIALVGYSFLMGPIEQESRGSAPTRVGSPSLLRKFVRCPSPLISSSPSSPISSTAADVLYSLLFFGAFVVFPLSSRYTVVATLSRTFWIFATNAEVNVGFRVKRCCGVIAILVSRIFVASSSINSFTASPSRALISVCAFLVGSGRGGSGPFVLVLFAVGGV